MRVKALLPFNAFGYLKREGEEFEIEDKGIKLDLEKLGWIVPIEDQPKSGKKAKIADKNNDNDLNSAELKEQRRKANE